MYCTYYTGVEKWFTKPKGGDSGSHSEQFMFYDFRKFVEKTRSLAASLATNKYYMNIFFWEFSIVVTSVCTCATLCVATHQFYNDSAFHVSIKYLSTLKTKRLSKYFDYETTYSSFSKRWIVSWSKLLEGHVRARVRTKNTPFRSVFL